MEEKKSRVEMLKEISEKEIAEISAIVELIREKDRKIREKCQFLQAVIDTMPNPVYTKDTEARFRLCNKSFQLFIGLSDEHIIGKTVVELFPNNKTAKFVYEKDLELLKKGGTEVLELNVIFRPGESARTIQQYRSTFRNEDGKISGIICSIFDITDRILRERDLFLLQERFYRAFHYSPIPKIITKNVEILDVNSAALQLLEFERNELIGKSVFDLRTRSGKSIFEKIDQFNYEFFHSKMINDNNTINNLMFNIYTKNDNLKTVLFSASKYPVQDGFCTLSVIRDITDFILIQEELKKRNFFLSQLMDALPNPIFYKTVDGIYRGCNRKYEEYSGFTRDELIGKNVYNLFPKHLADKFFQEDQEVFNRKIEKSTEFTDKDGRYLLLTKAPYFNENGDVEGLIGIIFDLTSRKQIERDLIKSKNEWELTFDMVPQYMAVLDENQNIVKVNKALSDLVGLSKEEIIGKKCYEIVHGLSQPIESCPFKQLNFLNKSATIEVYNEKFERTFLVSCSALLNCNDKLVGAIHSMIDITERKKMEEQLLLSEQKYKNLYNHAPIMNFTISSDGRICELNEYAATQLGYTVEELLDTNVIDIFHEEDRIKVMDQIEQCLNNPDQIFRYTLRKRHKNGDIVFVEETAKVIEVIENITDLKADKKSLHIQIACRNVTEEIKSNLKLSETLHQYQAVVELSNDAIAIVQDEKHVFVNKKYLEIFGVNSLDQVIGKVYPNVHPRDLDFVMEINRRRASGLIVPTRYEFKGIRSDNNKELNIEVSVAKITYNNKPASLAYLRDITNKRKYEQLNDYPISKFDILPEMICRNDNQFRFIYVNETYCKFVGKSKEELCSGRYTIFDFIPDNEKERLKQYFNSFNVNHTLDSIMNKVILYNGDVVYINWINKAFFDYETGELIELQSIGQLSDTELIKSG